MSTSAGLGEIPVQHFFTVRDTHVHLLPFSALVAAVKGQGKRLTQVLSQWQVPYFDASTRSIPKDEPIPNTKYPTAPTL